MKEVRAPLSDTGPFFQPLGRLRQEGGKFKDSPCSLVRFLSHHSERSTDMHLHVCSRAVCTHVCVKVEAGGQTRLYLLRQTAWSLLGRRGWLSNEPASRDKGGLWLLEL